LRTLVVNADDFGYNRDVNRGIIRAHREGILTATTLMANGAAFPQAVELAGANPALDIGVHLQMVEGPSLSRPGSQLPPTVASLIRQLGHWNIYAELRAQVEAVLAAGIQPTHLDTHKHTHLLPPVLAAVARISEDFHIPYIRRPFDLPLDAHRAAWQTRLARRAMAALRGHFTRVLNRHGARSTEHFAGFVWTGNYTADDLLALIPQLPPGVTEFMCHPGEMGPELAEAPTRLKQSRVAELQALTDPRLRPALAEQGIRLARYRDLPG
jgi:predicted glycoside hydrolase/deacetylase ChbG (UPF0249 family)